MKSLLTSLSSKGEIVPLFGKGDCVTKAEMARNVMLLNLYQHLMESKTYETLKRVQGDKKRITTQSHRRRGKESSDLCWKYSWEKGQFPIRLIRVLASLYPGIILPSGRIKVGTLLIPSF